MCGPQTLDELVDAIMARGWVFAIEFSDIVSLNGNGKMQAASYEALIVSDRGEMTWDAETPRDALAGAFEAMDRLHDGAGR